MSYHNLPEHYPGMYQKDASGKWVAIIAKNKDPDVCHVKFCTRPSGRGVKTNKTDRSLKCTTCRLRLWRANNPMKAVFNAVRNKASRRGIEFNLTFDFFVKLCEETDYHKKRGRRPDAYHLDRVDPYGGYTDDNVRVITASENCSKRHQEFQGPDLDDKEPDQWDESEFGDAEPTGDDPF